MLDSLRVLLADSLPSVPDLAEPVTSQDVRVAACALMLEVAYSDGRLSEEERKLIDFTTYTCGSRRHGKKSRRWEDVLGKGRQQLPTKL